MNKIFFIILLSFSLNGISQIDLLNTDFQSGMPTLYTIVDNDGLTPAPQVSEFTSAWITVLDPENALDTVAASTSYFSPIGTANRWMITEPITLGSYGNFIEWEAKSHDASYPDNYLILVSTTDDQLASFTDTIGHIAEENAEWTLRTVNLSSKGYDNQTLYIAFVNITTDGYILYIDDIHAWKEDDVNVSEIASNITLSVYPNPTKGEITIKASENIENVLLLTSTGQQILQTKETNLSIDNYPNGVYFLQVKTANQTKTIKVLKY